MWGLDTVLRRIESKTSRTAEFTCLVRCLSYLEKRAQYQSDDNVSLIVMNSLVRFLIRFAACKRLYLRTIPAGMYEYVIIYASVVRQEHLYEGERELFNGVAGRGERFCFGIENGHLDGFLSAYGLKALQVMDASALQDMFFRDERGELVGKVNGTHCIVTAVKN